jgi:hypothetical protein
MTLRLIIHGLTSPTTHSSRQLQNLSPIPVGSFVYMFKLAAALNSNCYASDTVAATRWIMATTSKLRRRRGRRNDDELNPFSMMPPKGQKRLEQCVDCHLRKTSTRQRITFENTVACKRNDTTPDKRETNPFDLPPPPGQKRIDILINPPAPLSIPRRKRNRVGKSSCSRIEWTHPFSRPPPIGQMNIQNVFLTCAATTTFQPCLDLDSFSDSVVFSIAVHNN